MMTEISRKEAESLIKLTEIVATDVKRNSDTLNILLTLSDKRSFLIRYNLQKHQKSYYLDKPPVL